ncbi:hypothetical protein BJ508DRAFT_111099 [Ascobolus immersus RN42]|uniref:Uncharacterized protein n=1 Tax=Ascobolus immersus RN42 TaxID=1160509 RepID=A0A3N4IIX5_ASCIM|nr:hypothetical protein BJ508DRAFT_111099 [Ascobolus immersus RN42]
MLRFLNPHDMTQLQFREMKKKPQKALPSCNHPSLAQVARIVSVINLIWVDMMIRIALSSAQKLAAAKGPRCGFERFETLPQLDLPSRTRPDPRASIPSSPIHFGLLRGIGLPHQNHRPQASPAKCSSSTTIFAASPPPPQYPSSSSVSGTFLISLIVRQNLWLPSFRGQVQGPKVPKGVWE